MHSPWAQGQNTLDFSLKLVLLIAIIFHLEVESQLIVTRLSCICYLLLALVTTHTQWNADMTVQYLISLPNQPFALSLSDIYSTNHWLDLISLEADFTYWYTWTDVKLISIKLNSSANHCTVWSCKQLSGMCKWQDKVEFLWGDVLKWCKRKMGIRNISINSINE